MPAARKRATWSGRTVAVSATIGTSRCGPGSARMRAVAAIPSTTGI
jgi:hypothetical protein